MEILFRQKRKKKTKNSTFNSIIYISMDLKYLYRAFHQTAAEHTCLGAHKIFSRIDHFGEQQNKFWEI